MKIQLLLRFLILLLLLGNIAVYSRPYDEHKTLPLGSPAPDFNLPGVDGKTYSLASFKEAKIVIIVFTCNHCPTAQAYEDRIIQLTDDYKNKGVAVIAVMPN